MKTTFIYLFIILSIISCNKLDNKTNLKNSASLYVQMHAKDPVNWHVWSDNIWGKAKEQNKLILLSIGYSACHWCHVMQHESFQNKEIAEVMNQYYYSVKIDREEFPDIDAHYAELQEKLTGWAGWPMHFILNAEKKVIWTGIYLKPKKWKALLLNVANNYAQDSSFRLTEIIENKPPITEQFNSIEEINAKLFSKLDTINGGLIPTRYSRKYPSVPLLNYLLHSYTINKSPIPSKYLQTTANNMALGGINDQIEGGFFRFSMDTYWHIPHFEKMLYTNAQLINFYANAYLIFEDKLYKQIAIQTANFVIKQLHSPTPLFYGSMDADQITEGSYYIYSLKELKKALQNDYSLAQKYYNILPSWKWENNSYHLNTSYSDSLFAKNQNLSLITWIKTKKRIKAKLLKVRQNRINPNIDPKLITSWNALLMEAFANTYKISQNKQYLHKAQAIARFLHQKFESKNKLQHFYLANKSINAKDYPEDYLYTAKALISLYNQDFDEDHILFARKLFDYYINNRTKFMHFPSDDRHLPSVIACENYLANYFNIVFRTKKYLFLIAKDNTIYSKPENYGSQLSFMLSQQNKQFELLINGNKETILLNSELNKLYLPQMIMFVKQSNSVLPILNDIKYSNEKAKYYLCTDGNCFAPTSDFNRILKQVVNGYSKN